MARRSSSKFKNVFAEPAKGDSQFQDIRNPMTSGESSYVAASATMFAVSKSGGGGPVYVFNHNSPGRLGSDVPMLQIGRGKTLDMAFSPFMDNMIAVGGEDQNISIGVLPPEGLTETIKEPQQVCKGHIKKISLLAFNPVANNIISSASYDKTVRTFDLSSGAQVNCFEGAKDNIYSLAWNANGSLLASNSKDKNLYIYDPRQGEPMATLQPFDGAKSSKCWWMPDKNWLGTVGFSRSAKRQIRIYDMANLDTPILKQDIDNASSVIMPYYDNDTSMLYFVGKGDGGISWYEVKNDKRKLYKSQLGFRQPCPQKGGCFLPKRGLNVMKCEMARFLKLTRDAVIPISFICPRRSESYQTDLYPDTHAGVPALQADEWLTGTDADPILKSLDPDANGDDGPKVTATFVKKASYAELEKENESLRTRVKELEEQLADLVS